MRRSILACGLLLALAGISTAAAATNGTPSGNRNSVNLDGHPAAHARSQTRAVTYWSRHIRTFRRGTRHWLLVIRGRPPHRVSRSATARRALQAHSVSRLRYVARTWRHREHAAWRRATHPPRLAAWNCIHRYEGSWADSGGPYWGGLQMDLSFQASYGGWLLRHKGTANHWSRLEQIWTAVRAWRVRGFSPWPNTARYCGVY